MNMTRKIDNFDIISKTFLFKEDLIPEIADDCFYMVQIKTRSKDTGEKPKLIHTLFVESREYLLSHKDMIVKFCETFNARAYISVNPSSYKKCVLGSFNKLSTMVNNGHYHGILSLPEKVAGEYTNPLGKEHKKWVVDLDGLMTEDEARPFVDFIMNEYNESRDKTSGEITIIPTVNGSHLIATPFDKRGFKKRWPDVQIHENNPTILYYGG